MLNHVRLDRNPAGGPSDFSDPVYSNLTAVQSMANFKILEFQPGNLCLSEFLPAFIKSFVSPCRYSRNAPLLKFGEEKALIRPLVPGLSSRNAHSTLKA